MSVVANAIISAHLIIIMSVMLVYSIKRLERKSLTDKLFIALLITAICMLILHFLRGLDGMGSAANLAIIRISNFLLYAANPAIPCIWLFFVLAWVNKGPRKLKTALRCILFLNAVNVSLVIATLFTGWFYTIGAGGIYTRGPCYAISTAFMFVPIPAVYFLILTNKKLLGKVFKPMLLFPVPPMIGIILQSIRIEIPFALNFVVISSLIILLYLQDRSIYSDSLTGVGNRRQLYTVLSERIMRSSPGRTFSLIMLDIDDFKVINDTYGHEAGDRILVETATLLKESVRACDYVIRFGGDEFILVADISEEGNLKVLLDRIELNRRKLNEKGKLPMKLSFSLGSIVYKHGSKTGIDQLIKMVDGEMYTAKKRKGHRLAIPSENLHVVFK